ncbi:hypothetical protein EK0264_12615 [Epidermidibacterium keratini]|uniref:Uncharacterized protein n=1 Tax=Epidermidibacterium keratini TaxID=1891644 RepID=A0A7L4YQI4_9ACTN|nr:hypothetical protein [Epidermidibacterium keratini]QHC01049.1 hypothetical protein EK0264_12615 [Epidermidibacterium keratini]
MQWSDLQLTHSTGIAEPLHAAGDLLLCPDGPVALVPVGHRFVFGEYDVTAVWVSVSAMPETVKELDERDQVTGTLDRAELWVAAYPVVADGALLRSLANFDAPVELLRALLNAGREVRALAEDPADR